MKPNEFDKLSIEKLGSVDICSVLRQTSYGFMPLSPERNSEMSTRPKHYLARRCEGEV
jgi:hypothetical protein